MAVRSAALALALTLAAPISSAPLSPFGAIATVAPTFAPHDVDRDFRGGYAVATADFNRDGKPDVIANSLQGTDLAWYENPSWARHVIAADQRQIVNEAIADLDGDGIPEIAFQSAFAMQPANSAGLNWIARHD